MTTIVNLLGSSGSSKSTTAMGLTYKLRLLGYKVEYVPEYAKDLVYEESEHKLKHQLYVFSKQLKRLDVLLDKGLDYIVTDSPLILGLFYSEKYKTDIPFFKELVLNSFKDQNQINFFLTRSLPFDTVGRLQSQEESDNDSLSLLDLLNTHQIKYTPLKGDNDAVNNILHFLSMSSL